MEAYCLAQYTSKIAENDLTSEETVCCFGLMDSQKLALVLFWKLEKTNWHPQYSHSGFERRHLASYYSHTGRPSVDPEPMICMLIIGH